MANLDQVEPAHLWMMGMVGRQCDDDVLVRQIHHLYINKYNPEGNSLKRWAGMMAPSNCS